MKRLALVVLALCVLFASTSRACERRHAHAIRAPLVAVPLIVEDPYASRVFVAPIIQPLFLVPQPAFVPQFQPTPALYPLRIFAR